MSVPEGVARLCGTVGDATDSPRGMESERANLPTWSIEEEAALTQLQIANGRAASATGRETIRARSGPRLSEPERLRLLTIRKNWDRGWLPMFEECRFLLELAERME